MSAYPPTARKIPKNLSPNAPNLTSRPSATATGATIRPSSDRRERSCSLGSVRGSGAVTGSRLRSRSGTPPRGYPALRGPRERRSLRAEAVRSLAAPKATPLGFCPAEGGDPSRGIPLLRNPAWRASLGALADPLLAADVELLLPERHRLFEGVDRLAAGVERRRAMRRRDGDDDTRLADLDRSDAVVDRDVDHVVPVA